MFEDSLLFNLAVFFAGQIVAYLYLRTGRRSRGVALMIGGWVLGDVALLARFAFDDGYAEFLAALWGMQLWSLFELVSYAVARMRRRTQRTREERERLYRLAFTHYLRNEYEPAITHLRAVLRRDPWDVETALALGTALARSGDARRARGFLRSARSLDVRGEFAEPIADELGRLGKQAG